MKDLVEELEKAGDLLGSALDRYLEVCFAIRDYSHQANSLISVPRAVADRLSRIFLLIASYSGKIGEANLAISQARNRLPALVPICSLPTEILVSILHQVASTYEKPWKCRLQHKSMNYKHSTIPEYPDLLSHVCAHWRRIMINSPAFWAHIDLVMRSQGDGFLARARTYAARAGKMLLDIHVYLPKFYSSSNKLGIEGGVLDVLATLAPRVRSLNLDTPQGSHGLGELVLHCCVNNCIPGTFTELILADSALQFVAQGVYNPSAIAEGVPAGINRDKLEQLVVPLTVLRLDGLAFPWTHPVYHGLVELYLVSNSWSGIQMTESELIGILSSSPRLQILHIDGPISKLIPKYSSVPPVYLEDLQILSLPSIGPHALETVLRLLAPGPKPLRFILAPCSGSFMALAKNEIKSFFARSNLAHIHVTNVSCQSDYSTLIELLRLSPHLQILVLGESTLNESVGSPFGPDQPGLISTPLHIGVLYLTRCKLDLGWFKEMVKHHVVGMVAFWKCTIADKGRILSDRECQSNLSIICPGYASIGEEEPNPFGYWSWPFSHHVV